MALRRTSLTAGELAKSAALGRTSIYPALRQLERAGIVEFIGAGSQRPVQLRDRHPLSRILRELFRTEARRIEALTAALRELLSHLPHRPMSAWVNETAENAQNGDTLSLFVVARPEELDKTTDYLNAKLADVERKYDLHISVQGLTRSELQMLHKTPMANLDAVVLVAGVPPVALLERPRAAARTSSLTSHDEHDARSRRLAVAIAAKIRRDPGLIAIAEDRVRRRAHKAGPGERRELMEWIRILSTMSPARLQRFLAEDSERAVRLRQTLPALNLLSPAEREAIVRSQTDAEVIAAVTRR
ncbi:MAG TPA: winged helix-turn-helix domain-containing protein [Vicinamibacterales bacterium]|nr:winged helix-turn-helix domain-containing protein [Vicinamibacterales bacterium]